MRFARIVVRRLHRHLVPFEGDDSGCHVDAAFVVDEFDLFDDDDLAVGNACGGVESIGRDLGSTLPLGSFIGPSEFFEHRRSRGEERRAPLERAVRVGLGDLELLQRTVRLSEIEARSRHGDRQLYAHRYGQARAVDRAPLLESAVGASDSALTVDDERKLLVGPGDPAVRPEFAQCQGEVADGVSRDGDGLADDSDTAGASGCRQCMLVRQLRVLVDHASRHREVSGDVVGVVLAEGLQLIASSARKVEGGDVLGDLRATLATILRRARGPGILTIESSRRSCAWPAVATRASVAAAEPTGVSVSADGAVPVTTERTITITTDRAITVTTERAIPVLTERAVTITTNRTVTVTTERTIPVLTERAVTITTNRAIPVLTERPVTITTDGTIPVTTHRAIPVTTERTIPVLPERTVTITTDGTTAITTERPLFAVAPRPTGLSIPAGGAIVSRRRRVASGGLSAPGRAVAGAPFVALAIVRVVRRHDCPSGGDCARKCEMATQIWVAISHLRAQSPPEGQSCRRTTRTIARATKGAPATARPGADSPPEATRLRLETIAPPAGMDRPVGRGATANSGRSVVMAVVPSVVMVTVRSGRTGIVRSVVTGIALCVVTGIVPSVVMVTGRSVRTGIALFVVMVTARSVRTGIVRSVVTVTVLFVVMVTARSVRTGIARSVVTVIALSVVMVIVRSVVTGTAPSAETLTPVGSAAATDARVATAGQAQERRDDSIVRIPGPRARRRIVASVARRSPRTSPPSTFRALLAMS